MELTINPEWCKDFCPELAVYNKVFVKRSGKGLFSHITFTGPDECIASVIEKEKEFFNENNIYVIIADNKITMSEAEGTVVIHRHGCAHTRVNTFDVSNYKEFIVDDLFKRFDLDFSHIDKDKLFEKYKLKDLDQDELVNNVLLNHYAHFDDDVLREADFEDVVNSEQAKESEEPKKDTAVKESVENMTVKKPEEENTAVKESGEDMIVKKSEEENTAVKESGENIAVKEPEKNGTAAEKSADKSAITTEPEKDSTAVTESGEDENAVPKPTVPIAKKNDGYKIKDSLTEEEEARNAELLSALTVEYKNTIDYISGLKNARWNIMLNKMKDCVKNSTFNQQWCVLYLNMSEDTANELYSRLYELDEKTKKFHKEIVHQVEHLLCPICGEDSEEDITFLSKGLHFIECPHCYAKRAIEKK